MVLIKVITIFLMVYHFSLICQFENEKLISDGYMLYPKGYDTGHKALTAYLD